MYDFFASMAGARPEAISAHGVSPAGSAFFANDNFSAAIRYADGSVCTLVYTAMGPKGGLPKERVEVFCDGKAYLIDDFVKCVEYPSGQTLWEAGAADKGHAAEMSLLANAIRNGASEGPIPAHRIFETTAVSLHIEDLINGRAAG